MPGPKPTLGYPSRTAAVMALRAEGLDTGAIAARIGISRECVSALEHSAARHPRRPPYPEGRAVLLAPDTFAALGPHAARRCIAPGTLARLIIETVLDEWARGAAVDLFRDHLWRQLRRDAVREMLAELRGHDLVCWCPLDQPCHADVLIELANA